MSALDGADARVPDWRGDSLVPTSNLLTIYRRRASHVEGIGLPTLGFRETVDRLEKTTHPMLRVAAVVAGGGYPACVMFIEPEELAVVAALAVLGPMPPV